MATGFQVYPDPPTEPLSVGPGQTSVAIPIAEFNGADSTAGDLNTMFIRVATEGQPPAVILQADGGTPVTVPATNLTQSLSSGATGTPMTATMRQDGAGVYLLRVRFGTIPAPDPPGFSWLMQIRNTNAGAAQDFTWVVASSDDEAKQPWINTPAASPLGSPEVPVNAAPLDLTLPVQNLGTGDLVIADSAGTDLGNNFTLKTVPPVIPPLGVGNLVVTFTTPGAVGLSETVYDISSNDDRALTAGNHNQRVTLQGRSFILEAALVLDASGSMNMTPAGGGTSTPSDRRWEKMTTAASIFLDVLAEHADGFGTIGIVTFPGPEDIAATVYGPRTIDRTDLPSMKESFIFQAPGGGTPMGAAIAEAMGTVGTWGAFASDADSLAGNRRWMLLMSDGKHNWDRPPSDFLATDPNHLLFAQSFKFKKVNAFTVAYGDPGAAEVDHNLLQTIATASSGKAEDAGTNDAGQNLRNAFTDAVVTALAVDYNTDPAYVLTVDQPERTHTVAVAPFDRKVTFIVSWDTPDPEHGRIEVRLMTPLGEHIARDNWESFGEPGIAFHEADNYQVFVFDESFLHGTFPPRSGNWTLVVTCHDFADRFAREPYAYDVITDSRLKLATSFDRAGYMAGDRVRLTATLTMEGAPIPDAAVSLRLSSPQAAVDNWLASQHVNDDYLERAFGILLEQGGEPVSMLRAKAYALNEFFKLPFASFTRTEIIPLTYAPGRGQYVADVSAIATPGSYEFSLSAMGQTADGTLFRREARARQRLQVLPDPAASFFDAVYRLENDARADLRIWPRDRFGNAIMLDWERRSETEPEPRIRFEVHGADRVSNLQYNLDGSYGQTVNYVADTEPLVDVFFDDVPLIKDFPLANPHIYRYADTIEDFVQGAEAIPNAHANPDDALGDVFRRDFGTFVALGALGSLTVAIGGSVILAGGRDDVVVFVYPARDLRPYGVEGRLADGSGTWAELGESPGTSMMLSLADAALDAVEAIRIRDLSGRTHGDPILPGHPEPLDAPGVGIIGIGCRNVS